MDPYRWLLVELPNGNWEIYADDENRPLSRIICTYRAYAEAQADHAQHMAQLWPNTPF